MTDSAAVRDIVRRCSRIALTDRDRNLTEYVRRFRLLSRDQIMSLGPFNSLTRVNTRLGRLVQAHILSRKMLPVLPDKGGAQALYFLAIASRNVIDIDDPVLLRSIRQISRWDSRQVDHVVAANQALIDVRAAVKCESSGEILAFRTEPELRELLSERPLVPDGWISWIHSGNRFNVFLEVDLQHEGLRAWRQKVLRYVEYAESNLHQERFGFRSFRVCVLVKSKARLEHLRQIGVPAGQLLIFGVIGEIRAENFLASVWRGAGEGRPIRLLEA